MKTYADRHRTDREFNIGDWVYLRLQPYRQSSVASSSNHKLSPRFYGPYQIQARIGKVAYRLKLPTSAKIHPVFHVSLLKPKLGTHDVPSSDFPTLPTGSDFQWIPEAILDRGLFKQHNAPVVKWLIKWMGLPEADATWEPATDILARYPSFQA